MRAEPQFPELPALVGGILVGGASRRMGRAKALLEWRGGTVLEHLVSVLASVVPEVVLLGELAALPPRVARLPALADSPGRDGGRGGPLRGLLAAFAAKPDRGWLVLACDQPLLTPTALSWLVGERRRERIAVLTRLGAGRIEPFPGLFEPGCRGALEALVASGSRGSLQPLAAVDGVAVVPVPVERRGEWRGANSPQEWVELAATARPQLRDADLSDRGGES